MTRQFKIAIGSLKMFSQHDLENLTKFIDHKNDGFIEINEVLNHVKIAASVSNAHTNKWTK